MNINDKKLANDAIMVFLEKLGSGDPTPGGGAAAALSSALGAALLMMVANHTIGKEKYAEFEELNIRVRDEAAVLRQRLAEGIDNDADAFLKVSAAFGMPRKVSESEGLTEEELASKEAGLKAARSAAIGTASVEAAEAPLMVMRDSAEALRLAAKLPGCSNANLLSDVFVAARCLQSGLASAAYNVEANLPAIRKRDPELADRMETECIELLEEGARLTDQILKG